MIDCEMHLSSLLQLMRITSPAFPIGAYAYSQGLEFSCEQQWVKDQQSAKEWIEGLLLHSLTYTDVPVLSRLYTAWQCGDIENISVWNKFLLAVRESSELKQEDINLGRSCAKLLNDLNIFDKYFLPREKNIAYATAFSFMSFKFGIGLGECCAGYLWVWAENQVSAAVKLIPLGQTAGQRITSTIIELIPRCVQIGLSLTDSEIGNSAFALGIASAKHENQYTRLFRS